MGRATIVSGGPTGRYTIALDYGTAERDARVAKFDAKIAEMEDRAIWQQGQVDGFQGGLDSLAVDGNHRNCNRRHRPGPQRNVAQQTRQ